jgi:two-component system sensor histidine kinase/response regulator
MRIRPTRILVVEDEDSSRLLLENLFVLSGFSVQTASNGAEALRRLDADVPDLLVLDLMLPWVNGFEVLATIRDDPALNALPVIVITAVAASDSDLQAFGPLMVVRKPFDSETLVPLVHQLLGHQPAASRSDPLES